MSMQEAARVLGVDGQFADVTFSSVSHDTRTLMPGSLYVALRGERLDGHEFIKDAIAKGAAGLLVDHEADYDLPSLVVPDTLLGLQLLASEWRSRFFCPVVGITGSNGKTTVKEMVGAILQKAGQTLVTRGNYNNHIGVPLTLLELKPEHDFAVIEMGMNHAGELSQLTAMVRPNVVVINNAAAAHLEGLGSVENVARAKGEIIEGLNHNGIAILNGDDEFISLWQQLAATRQTLTFGFSEACEVRGVDVVTGPENTMTVRHAGGEFELVLSVPGRHNLSNALAASAVALSLDIDPDVIVQVLKEFQGVKGRMQMLQHASGACIIDDTYNANPASLDAALQVLAGRPGKKILVLGDMGELGADTAAMHLGVGERVASLGIDQVLTMGNLTAATSKAFGDNGHHFKQIDDLSKVARENLHRDTTMLIKGSRAMGMERLVKALMEATEVAN